jgi:hypothetical protein
MFSSVRYGPVVGEYAPGTEPFPHSRHALGKKSPAVRLETMRKLPVAILLGLLWWSPLAAMDPVDPLDAAADAAAAKVVLPASAMVMELQELSTNTLKYNGPDCVDHEGPPLGLTADVEPKRVRVTLYAPYPDKNRPPYDIQTYPQGTAPKDCRYLLIHRQLHKGGQPYLTGTNLRFFRDAPLRLRLRPAPTGPRIALPDLESEGLPTVDQIRLFPPGADWLELMPGPDAVKVTAGAIQLAVTPGPGRRISHETRTYSVYSPALRSQDIRTGKVAELSPAQEHGTHTFTTDLTLILHGTRAIEKTKPSPTSSPLDDL